MLKYKHNGNIEKGSNPENSSAIVASFNPLCAKKEKGMKKKVLALVLIACMCLPLILASCSSSLTVRDLIGDRDEAKMLNDVTKLEFDGTVKLANDAYIVVETNRKEVLSLGDTGLTYTKEFVDYRFYRTLDQALEKTISVRVDPAMKYSEDDEITNCIYSMACEDYLYIKTTTVNDTYKHTILSRGGKVVFEEETNDSALSPAFFGESHFVYDSILYRIEDNCELTEVKSLKLTSVAGVLSQAEKVVYANGKYVALMDDYVLIYNDKLSSPVAVDFPVKEYKSNSPHAEQEISLEDFFMFDNGVVVFKYIYSEELSCDSCETTCEEYEANKAKYQLVENGYGTTYEYYSIDPQSASAKKLDASGYVVGDIFNIADQDSEYLASFTGYEIANQMIDRNKGVLGCVLSDGTLSRIDIPAGVISMMPLSSDRYVAIYKHGYYIVDNKYNIVAEFPMGNIEVEGLIRVDDTIYSQDMELVYKVDDSGEIVGYTESSYVVGFPDSSSFAIVSTEGIKTVDIPYGYEVVSVNKSCIVVADDYSFDISRNVMIYNANGELLTSYKAFGNATVSVGNYDDMCIIRALTSTGKNLVIILREVEHNSEITVDAQTITHDRVVTGTIYPDYIEGGAQTQSGSSGGLATDPLA